MTTALSMTPAAVADRLAAYNRWRRGDDVEMPAPVDLGRDIDAAVELLRRVDDPMDVAALAAELADVVICVDLLAMHYGIDLAAAVVAKFDATSVKMGLSTRLGPKESADG